MADSQNIDDVLASIRRLVSEEAAEQANAAAAKLTGATLPIDALVLGNSDRVIEPENPYQSIPPLQETEDGTPDAEAAADPLAVDALSASPEQAEDVAQMTDQPEMPKPPQPEAADIASPEPLEMTEDAAEAQTGTLADTMPIFTEEGEEDADDDMLLDFIESLPDPVETIPHPIEAAAQTQISEGTEQSENAPDRTDEAIEAVMSLGLGGVSSTLVPKFTPTAGADTEHTLDTTDNAPVDPADADAADASEPAEPEDTLEESLTDPFGKMEPVAESSDWAAAAEMDALGFDAPIKSGFDPDTPRIASASSFFAPAQDKAPARTEEVRWSGGSAQTDERAESDLPAAPNPEPSAFGMTPEAMDANSPPPTRVEAPPMPQNKTTVFAAVRMNQPTEPVVTETEDAADALQDEAAAKPDFVLVSEAGSAEMAEQSSDTEAEVPDLEAYFDGPPEDEAGTAEVVEIPAAESEVLEPDAPGPVEDMFEDDEEDILSGGIGLDMAETAMDTEALRELVAEVVRQELAGALGERITRNVRKLVRRELKMMFSGDEFD